MKRLLLTLILLIAGLSPSYQADASGSNTVFLPVRLTDYKFTNAYSDDFFNTSTLYDYLETSQNNRVLVARVSSYVYRTAYYYTYWGYEMDLGFSGYETVTFKLYPNLGAILGVNANEDIIVLLPQVPSTPAIGTGVLLN